MKYPYRVDMVSQETKRFIKSMDAYTSLKRAENACERLNDYAYEDPFYGRVFYEVREA